MPLLEFENMGRVSDSILMSGTVMTIDYEKDLMDVSVAVPGFKDDGSVKFDTLLVKGVSVYYHCEDSVDMNGDSIKGGASAFFHGDKVVVMADDRVSSKYRVIAHDKSKRPCLKRCVLWTLPSKNSSPCFQLWSISQSKNDGGKITYSFKPVKWPILVKNDKTGALEEKSDLYSFYNFYKASQIKELTDSNSYFIFSPPAEDTSSFAETGVNFEYKFLLLALWNSNGPLVSTSDQRVHGSAYTTSDSSQYTSFWVHRDQKITEAIFSYAYRFYYNKATFPAPGDKVWEHDQTGDYSKSMKQIDGDIKTYLFAVTSNGSFYSEIQDQKTITDTSTWWFGGYSETYYEYGYDKKKLTQGRAKFIMEEETEEKSNWFRSNEKYKYTFSRGTLQKTEDVVIQSQTHTFYTHTTESGELYSWGLFGKPSRRQSHIYMVVPIKIRVDTDNTIHSTRYDVTYRGPDGFKTLSTSESESKNLSKKTKHTITYDLYSSFFSKIKVAGYEMDVEDKNGGLVTPPNNTYTFSGDCVTSFSCEAGKDYVLYTCVIKKYNSDGTFNEKETKRVTKYITRDGEFDVPPPLLQKSTISGFKNDLANGVKASDDFKICLHSFSGI